MLINRFLSLSLLLALSSVDKGAALTSSPTESPAPSPSPSDVPTVTLSQTFTSKPTMTPSTAAPQTFPTEDPTESPAPSPSPSDIPTPAPSVAPSRAPTPFPTRISTSFPSFLPTSLPSSSPTISKKPTEFPTTSPTVSAKTHYANVNFAFRGIPTTMQKNQKDAFTTVSKEILQEYFDSSQAATIEVLYVEILKQTYIETADSNRRSPTTHSKSSGILDVHMKVVADIIPGDYFNFANDIEAFFEKDDNVQALDEKLRNLEDFWGSVEAITSQNDDIATTKIHISLASGGAAAIIIAVLGLIHQGRRATVRSRSKLKAVSFTDEESDNEKYANAELPIGSHSYIPKDWNSKKTSPENNIASFFLGKRAFNSSNKKDTIIEGVYSESDVEHSDKNTAIMSNAWNTSRALGNKLSSVDMAGGVMEEEQRKMAYDYADMNRCNEELTAIETVLG